MTNVLFPIPGMSVVKGIPLSEEKGTGALTLGGFLKEVTAAYGPREVAVMHTADGIERWSYNDLWEKSMAVAKALLACGVGKGTRVGILMTNRFEFVTSLFGTALAGGVATAMSTFSTPSELEVLVKNSGCSVLMLEQNILKKDFAAIVSELEPQISTIKAGELFSNKFPFLRYLATVDNETDQGAIEGWGNFLSRGASISDALVEATAATVAPADPGVLLFSSGSTGKPKGILNAHRGVCLQMWRWRNWLQLANEGVRCWSANGFFWSGNFAWAMGSTLAAGGSLVLQRVFQAEEALELMEKEKVTFLVAWPHQWAQLVDAKNWNSVDLSSLVYIDKSSPVAAHPTVNTDWVDATHAYGNTETFTLSSVFPANTPKEISAGSHGVPAAGNTFKIVDPLSGDTVALGERGEIAVKGPTLMLGYIGTPLDESVDENGFLRTGDGGYFDENGRLIWEGRLNDIIKTGGANVSPVEIDMVIEKAPGVKVTKTVGVPDELLGELVVACIVPQDGFSLTEDEIRNFAKQELASYKVPRRVLFFDESELETTGSNKVKTAELRKLAAERLANS
ncbi:class I adenylate-forming enzyme family protein [Halioxenophilus sp. WMMB6]|uniref:class I adenylate-forming enzyme family protein n=1 Tax=Halioxenophilus sp. WMMB6 TaxID=3073815 RepID=UPI00295F1A17|nr:class I adenylate-forming enzyme family protein [Halioxenophilus sp. WMMB6]